MAQHELIFYKNRNTPKVVSKGADPGKVPDGYGPQVSRRAATADEEKVIARGDWVRVDKKGNKPSDSNYHGGSNYRPQLRDKSNQTSIRSDGRVMNEAAAVPSVQTQPSSVYAQGPDDPPPVWKKIIKIDTDANGNITSEVVSDYQIKTDLSVLALVDGADSDDPPAQQQLLMTAWQALAVYLGSCDDEDKAGALSALKMVSNLMADGPDDGPTPTGTFGVTTQAAAVEAKQKDNQAAPKDKNGKPLPPWMAKKMKKKQDSSMLDCALDGRTFGTESGFFAHLRTAHSRRGK